MVSVRIRSVVKTFGTVRALDAVSLEIQRGELFFLLGPSGCGKTTLLRSIAGFYIPDRGQILFDEQDVTRLPARRRGTAMVFQNYALWPHMSVEANVAFGLRVRRVPRDEQRRRVAAALDMVRMGAYAKRRPNQLSGGQQQRVALARALVVRPQCLLLDEPLSNLDAKLRLEMRGEIRRLCKEFGLTAVYVTHDQKEALSVADRMAVMFGGRIGQLGTPEELYCRPDDQDVADFLGESNFVDATIVASDGDRRVLRTASGDILAGAGAGAPTGGACRVSIRYEAVSVDEVLAPGAAARPSAEARAANTLTARVTELTYLGETTHAALDWQGTRLTAAVPRRAGTVRVSPGDAVRCSIDPRDVIILPAGR
ncbi:MAG: Spermidine/putrescine import ATP-binding protein PotA [Phycisphaerae bacterium]|nr:Spermidine/putrescine import ATP-binding protein PotA [Phycisphaerae bacterium]